MGLRFVCLGSSGESVGEVKASASNLIRAGAHF